MTGLAAITGAGGFVGRHTLVALDRAGWRLRALMRSAPSLPQLGSGRAVEIVPGALSDPAALAALVAGVDAVIHIAGAIKANDPAGFMAVNASGTEALARAWRDAAPEAPFVLMSSMAAREPSLSPYTASKREGEDRLRRIAGGRSWRILRPSAVYGADDPETLKIFRAAALPVQPLLNGPDARVCIVEARDLADATVAALSPDLASGVYEVTDPQRHGYTWPQFVAEAVAALDGVHRGVQVPASALRVMGWFGDAVNAVAPGRASLTSGKVAEILHCDWGSRPEAQMPDAIWKPKIGISAGFPNAISKHRLAGGLRNRHAKKT